MRLAPGTRIGSYDIVSELGSGGMGEVYRAHDGRLSRDVALKILPDSMARDAEALTRFEREARAVAAISHPHIVTIYSTEEHGGIRFLTMELVEGQTLDRLIPEHGLAVDRFFDIAIALADALGAAHQKQITHRDLKPTNVMVAVDGRVKVLDFGLARSSDATAAADAATRQALTAAGTIVGTVPYMSPEQLEARPLDHRTDIFSFGVVAYEMATGRRPFTGDSSPALMSAILRDRPPLVTGWRRDLPDPLSRLIARCLEKSVQDRVQSAQEIAAELRTIRRSLESRGAALASGGTSRRMLRDTEARVAVLPFQARGGGAADALADGLTDDVTTGLSRFQYLRVILRVDGEKTGGLAADARTAEALGARYLVDGTVRMAGDAVRVSARLVDPSTGGQLWGETYDRTLEAAGGLSLFALQDDVASRIVTTIGDSAGMLPRALGAVLKNRPLDGLCTDELVLRYFAYLQHFGADEHQQLRDAFERALAVESDHALGWACYGFLIEQELSQGLNVRPDARGRGIRAAQRAIELDSGCQTAWRALASFHFFDRDLEGLRTAAERVIALNPLASPTPAAGMLLAYAGDWERGLTLIHRAIALNAQHPGWLHHVLFVDHYRKREYQEALAQAKLSNMPRFIWTPLMIAAAAGQLGRASDARAAFETLRNHHPEYLDARRVREHWSFWQWDETLVDRLMEGHARAHTLIGSDTASAATPRSGRTASIAVLPFTDLSAAKDQEWFCDGIAEEILNGLTQLPGLRVAARASAFSFRGRSDDLRTIGEKLNVATVLGGSVRRAGDRVRITAQLSDVSNGYQLWSERYDRELKDIFDVQDEIARAIADRLKVTLSVGVDERLVSQGTSNLEAYQLYLKGRALLYRRGSSIPPALELFRRAVAIDPGYAAAWAGVADAYTVLAYFAFVRRAEARPPAMEAATRAIELEPRSAEGHTALACAKLIYDNDRAGARQAFERALELNPSYGQGRCWYALFYLQWACGELDRGLAEARRALEADPLSAYTMMIVSACLATAEQFDDAIETAALSVRTDPDSFVARWELGVAQTHGGHLDDAIDTLRQAAAMSNGHVFATASLGSVLAALGRHEEAAEVHRELLARAAQRYVPAAFLALTADAAGDRDQAVAHARRAWSDREPPFILLARQMIVFKSLREDSRFQEILREMDAGPA